METEKSISMTIANNAIMTTAINKFLVNHTFEHLHPVDYSWKQTTLRGNKAVIQYNKISGYTLSVPLNNSTLLLFEGINIRNEKEILHAAEQFNLDGIKKVLGL